jgi:cell division protein FtsL
MVARAHPAPRPVPLGPRFHVVVDRRARRRRVGHLAFLAVAVFALFLLLIMSRIALDRSAFVIQDLDRQIAAEESRYWELRLQVSELRDPARIALIAAEMGMVYPVEVRSVEVPGLGSPGPGVEERWVSLKTLLSAQP